MKNNKNYKLLILSLILIATILQITFAGTPSPPTFIYNSTETVTPKPATYLNTTGGSFTTLVLNTTQQDYKWKAYVGNATGKLALQDQDNFSIYEWRNNDCILDTFFNSMTLYIIYCKIGMFSFFWYSNCFKF